MCWLILWTHLSEGMKAMWPKGLQHIYLHIVQWKPLPPPRTPPRTASIQDDGDYLSSSSMQFYDWTPTPTADNTMQVGHSYCNVSSQDIWPSAEPYPLKVVCSKPTESCMLTKIVAVLSLIGECRQYGSCSVNVGWWFVSTFAISDCWFVNVD